MNLLLTMSIGENIWWGGQHQIHLAVDVGIDLIIFLFTLCHKFLLPIRYNLSFFTAILIWSYVCRLWKTRIK